MTFTSEELEKYLYKNVDKKKGNDMFFELLKRANNNDLNYTEAYHFYNILKASYYDFGKPESFLVCKEPIFADLYRTYYKDLHGTTIKNDKRGNPISDAQKTKDLTSLENYYTEWEHEISNTDSSSERLMIEIARETRTEIRLLKKDPLFNTLGFLNKSNLYKFKLKCIVLRSRYIRTIILKHIDKFGAKIPIHFDSNVVEFDEFSVTHIFFRHYAQIMKQTELDKSFHTNDIDYTKIGIELKDILEQIDKSGLFKNGERKVVFEYKGKPFIVYITEKQRSVPGLGQQTYFRIDTFYPVEDTKELKLISALRQDRISDELVLLQ
ncbi:MAG: hypothetical protein KQH79_11420 [Bacteroidetes bacterium]|nr:hypothetical protein [Bacteroidota bacterium]